MHHCFEKEIAEKVGVNAAILYQNIEYWCEHNRKNKVNFVNGRYWVIHTVDQFSNDISYLTYHQIKLSLSKLREAKLILAEEHNRDKYNHTLWYTIA